MNKKLTLLVDENLIEKAKVYAKDKKSSLSKLVTNYLKLIIDSEEEPLKKVAPITAELKGIVKTTDDIDWKDDYADFLMDKYKW